MNELEKAQLAVEQANQAVLAASETIQKLVAENAALKAAFKLADIPSELTDVFGDTAVIEHDSTGDNQGHSVSWSWVGNQEDVIKAVLSAAASLCETPATDAFTAELRAQGVDEAAESAPWLYGSQMGVQVEAVPREELIKFAANLRAGRKG